MILFDHTAWRSKSAPSVAGCAAATLCLLITSLADAADLDAYSVCEIRPSNGSLVEDLVVSPQGSFLAGGAFPIDLTTSIWEEAANEDYSSEWGAWCYANEEGRVRGRVITGYDDDSPMDAEVALKWTRSYTRAPGTQDPDFTVNLSRLRIRSDGTNLEDDPSKIFAEMRFSVAVVGPYGAREIFKHRSRMEGQPERANFHFEQSTAGDAALTGADGASIHPASDGVDVEITDDLAVFELPSYTEVINLDRHGVAFGAQYTIEYWLDVGAGEHPDVESWAEAFFGDPLDADSGFVLSTTHPPVDQPATRCEATPDPMRFTDHQDGTITDSTTGLMWRRCPAGFDLDDAGTPADRSDDACVPTAGGTSQLTWQAALQAASSDATGGHDDWRAPNAKEIETLVAACIGPSLLDPLAFPLVAGSPFWSATPEMDDNASPKRAWQLDFSDGELRPASRLSTAYLRPVRDTGDASILSGVTVTAGNAAIPEGNGGTATLLFPVALSAPAAAEVAIDYVVSGLGATEGVDFTDAAGTLTIPAGETSGEIEVSVIGDTAVEHDEYILLQLSDPGAARLRKSYGIGTIVDDEPIFRLARSIEAAEQNADATLDIAVQLDRPAVEAIAIDYATRDDTAIAGNDYLAAAGTLVIQPGESEVVLSLTLVGDLLAESAERFEIEFDNADGAALLGAPAVIAVNIVDDDGPGTYAGLNDTGVTACATGNQTLLGCPQPGYPGQDAEFGRDVTDADPADGALGFSFVKRDVAGDVLANQASLYSQTPWDCVEDQVTGLFWEVKTDQPDDLRFSDHTFTWYNSSGANDGGGAGTPNGGICSDGVNCDTEKYVAAVNAAGVCGYADWRLATADELFTIAWLNVDSARGVDIDYFPNHFAPPDGRGYWSSSPSATDPQSALQVRLEAAVNSSRIASSAKNSTQRIRLVRGGVQLSQMP